MKLNSLLFVSLLAASSIAHAVHEGQAVPECQMELAGNAGKLNLADYKGKVVLVDFWASWCGPCKKSMPFLNSLRNQNLKKGFEIVAINVDETTDDAVEFLRSSPVDYPMAFDAEGRCPKVFDVKAMPSSYLVDRQGKVRHVHLGYRDEDQDVIRKEVDALLAE